MIPKEEEEEEEEDEEEERRHGVGQIPPLPSQMPSGTRSLFRQPRRQCHLLLHPKRRRFPLLLLPPLPGPPLRASFPLSR